MTAGRIKLWAAGSVVVLAVVLAATAALRVRMGRVRPTPVDGRVRDAGVDAGDARPADDTVVIGVVVPDARVGAATVELHQAGRVVSRVLDGSGRFELPTRPGPFLLYAFSADRQWQVVQCESTARSDSRLDGGSGELRLTWQPAAVLVGEVTDDQRHPLAAQLAWRPTFADAACNGLVVDGAADGAGRFALLHPVTSGEATVTAEADGFWPASQRVTAAPARLVLAPAASLSGVVQDERGQPVVGARVALATVNGGSATGAEGDVVGVDPRLRAQGELGVLAGPVPYPPLVAAPLLAAGADKPLVSDDKGRFVVARVVAGEVTVQAAHPQFATGSAQVTLHAGERGTVTIVVPDGTTVDGAVHDADGQAIEGADIALLDGTATRSDRSGHFTLTHVLVGQSLMARHAGFRPGRAVTAATVEITLERADHTLAGVVVDHAGQGIAGAEIAVGNGDAVQAVSDHDGRFTVAGLGAPPHIVRASRAGYAPFVATLASDDHDLHVELAYGAGVDGTVRDDRTGEVPPGARVELVTDHPVPLPLSRDHFSATGLPPGTATLHASAPGWVDVRRTVELPAGDHAGDITLRDVDLRLERGGTMVGTVTRGDGSPASKVEVRVGELRVRTDGDGHFRVDGVASGTAHVSTAGAEVDVEVRAGEESTAELRVEK